VGTTYSLDLIALLAAPVAFAFSDWQDRDGRPVLEPLALLKATRQYADKMLLFCQAGRISVPNNYQPLLAHLEGSIAEAFAPGEGSFHPKVWFLRYVAADDDVTYRMLCLSRNMTFDRSWDTMLSLEGPLRDRTNAIARNHKLGQFVEALPTMVRRKLSSSWRSRLTQLAHELRRVEFVLPKPFKEMKFWPIGITPGKTEPFGDRLDSLLVISPFVDAHFIGDIATYRAPLQLVSRPESLACLSATELAPFEKIWVLDERSEPETADTDAPAEAATAELPPTGDGAVTEPLMGLHAKVYVADVGSKGHLWTGSANATSAAFRSNVEFLIELIGKKADCGVAAILGDRAGSPQQHAACLAHLLKAYEPDSSETETDTEMEAFERLADALAKGIAARAPIAHCEPHPSSADHSLMIRPSNTGTVGIPPGYTLHCRPISLKPDQSQTATLTGDPWCRFERVSMLGLTSFFAWELASSDNRFSHTFVLYLPLHNAPANRSESILRSLLTDPDRVLRFLLLLLMNPDGVDLGVLTSLSGDQDHKGILPGMSESTLFESLLRALDRRPEQLDEVEQVIRDLEQSPEGRMLLPEQLREIWQPISEVRRQQQQQSMM